MQNEKCKMQNGGVIGERQEMRFESCYAEWDGRELTVGNSYVRRRWRVENGLLYATSLMDVGSGYEWLARPSERPAPYPNVTLPDEARQVHFRAFEKRDMPVEAPSLVAELRAEGASVALIYRCQIFSEAAGVVVQLAVEGIEPDAEVGAGATGHAAASGVELVDAGRPAREMPVADGLEALALAPQHLRLTQATLMDRTDAHNELVFENEWLLHTNEGNLLLQGNLFVMEDSLTRSGLIFLKQAPLPHARPVRSPYDLFVKGAARAFGFYGHGMGQGVGEGYAFTLLVYQGGRAGRTEALHRYQRQVRMYDPQRDGLFLSNTWGDRSQDSRIQAPFVMKEIEAGARLGVDVVQVDDGWERGRTSNSVESAQKGGVWEGYWAVDADFWTPDPERFPDGLLPVVEAARARGMSFGLWFGPDSANEFANWDRDAEVLLHYHRDLEINYFKIDGVKARTKQGEGNLRRFFDRVLQGSGGRVAFDLDVTAEVRPGYWGMMHVGPLFVENRYTDFHRYWPHQTLRNLWKLSHYVDPVRLRMEFLNQARNTDRYVGDPLAPACYRPDYLFATVMMANPLGWFEVSNLPPAYFETVAPLTQVWRAHRERLLGGRIFPIGETPDGTSWTGFATVDEDERGGYLLIFRELNARASWRTELPMFGDGRCRVEPLAGEGAVRLYDRALEVKIGRAQAFLFARVEAE